MLDEINGLHLLHYGYDFYVNSVPVFFRGRPTIYHIFLSCTLFAFLGSFSSLMVQHKPRVERVFRIYAVPSMISALVTLLYAIVLRFVAPPKWSKKQKIGEEVFFFFLFSGWMEGIMKMF